ncbi:dTDP-4-dehydrorhamnose reductase [Patescibacteria group bacterium]
MKILITGGKGQLGLELQNQLSKHNILPIDLRDCDITNFEQVKKIFIKFKPDLVIHCAAYTQVDKAETNKDKCMQVNGLGTRNVVVNAEEVKAKLIYVSTDYVFDGMKKNPYLEWDKSNPLSVYGLSKYWGEQMVKNFSSRYFIVRTAWLYGHGDNNFVKTIQRLSKEKDELHIVNDQIGSPTSTTELSRAIDSLINTELYGIYHTSCQGECSWYDFACEIVKQLRLKTIVKPIETKQFPLPAKRPRYSYLYNYMLETQKLYQMKDWKLALSDFLKEKTINELH